MAERNLPTATAFAGGSYETWFGEHSYLTTRAGEIIEKEALGILKKMCLNDISGDPMPYRQPTMKP